MPRRGYTLLEIVLVMALLVIVASMAMPSMDAPLSSGNVTAARDTVRRPRAGAGPRGVDARSGAGGEAGFPLRRHREYRQVPRRAGCRRLLVRPIHRQRRRRHA